MFLCVMIVFVYEPKCFCLIKIPDWLLTQLLYLKNSRDAFRLEDFEKKNFKFRSCMFIRKA